MNAVNRSWGTMRRREFIKLVGTPFALISAAAFFIDRFLSFLNSLLNLLLLLFLPQSNSLQSLFVRNPFTRSRGRDPPGSVNEQFLLCNKKLGRDPRCFSEQSARR
jgi:hypothetical protein